MDDLVLRSDRWAVTVRPHRGGRIVSLELEGVELLDQGIGRDDARAACFLDAGAQGWDELVPTLDPAPYPEAPWAGLELPDHGEAWRLPWRVVRHTALTLRTVVAGGTLPWELTRDLVVGKSIRCDYSLANRGQAPLLAYWCSHCLFRFELGMEVGVAGAEMLGALQEGRSVKLVPPPGSFASARLGWPSSGAAVELSWDPALTPHVGIWACNGDLGGYRQLAVEPATGGGDRPHPAAPPPRLKPGESLRWWFQIAAVRAPRAQAGAG